jgi:hypothetical protein
MTKTAMAKIISDLGITAGAYKQYPGISHIVLTGNSSSYAKETNDYCMVYNFDVSDFLLYEAKYYKSISKAYLTRVIDMSKIEAVVMLTPFSEGQLTSAA